MCCISVVKNQVFPCHNSFHNFSQDASFNFSQKTHLIELSHYYVYSCSKHTFFEMIWDRNVFKRKRGEEGETSSFRGNVFKSPPVTANV